MACLAALRRSYGRTPAEAPAEEPLQPSSTDELDRVAAERALKAAFAQQLGVQSICLLGIDPDASGAVAVMHWDVAAGPEALQLQNATLQIHDMPLECVPVGKRLRKYVFCLLTLASSVYVLHIVYTVPDCTTPILLYSVAQKHL